jgi:hypothetical protein
MTRLRAERPRNLGSIPDRKKSHSLVYSVQMDTGVHIASYRMGDGGYFRGDKEAGA